MEDETTAQAGYGIQQVREWGPVLSWSICGSGPAYTPRDAVDNIFPSDVEEYDVRGNMVMYLFRRFGYPISGWDDEKSVVSYYLTTPDPEILLRVDPKSTFHLSFGFGLSQTLETEAENIIFTHMRNPDTKWDDLQWKEHPIYQRIDAAIRAALGELLRPVYIRDVPYNLLGYVDSDNDLEAAPHSPQAGYGIGDFDPVKAANE